MDVQILEDIGLTNPQAQAYIALVEHGASNAPAIAKVIGESRSNTYKLLDRLCELQLVSKDTTTKRVQYYPNSPASLEQLIQRQSSEVDRRNRKLNAAMPSMLDFFFAHSEKPSIRYLQGKEGLTAIYKDQITTQQPVYYVRSTSDVEFMGFKELHHLRNLFPRFKIDRYMLSQDKLASIPILPEDRYPVGESDTLMRLHRTWINVDDYSAPVEWAAYGNKLSIIVFGQEAMGTVIESPAIADAFRQLFTMLDEGIRRRPDYKEFPRELTYTSLPEPVSKARANGGGSEG